MMVDTHQKFLAVRTIVDDGYGTMIPTHIHLQIANRVANYIRTHVIYDVFLSPTPGLVTGIDTNDWALYNFTIQDKKGTCELYRVYCAFLTNPSLGM